MFIVAGFWLLKFSPADSAELLLQSLVAANGTFWERLVWTFDSQELSSAEWGLMIHEMKIHEWWIDEIVTSESFMVVNDTAIVTT